MRMTDIRAYITAGLLSSAVYMSAEDNDTYWLPQPDSLPKRAERDLPLPCVQEVCLKYAHSVSKVFGIDVSHYQGNINWQLVGIDQNVHYVYIKATEGSGLVDSHYRRNFKEAKQSGILVGSYHFFSPSASALMQLKNFTDIVKAGEQDLIPIVDVERRGRRSERDFHSKLRQFLTGLERIYGKKPVIYTGVNFFNKYLAGKYSDYSFMIARYGDDVPELMEDVRIVLWQFTQEGRVAGVSGNVDRSCFLDKFGMQDIQL